MKFEDMADFLEEFQEHLEIKVSHWLFSEYTKHKDGDVRYKNICDFLDWIRKETQEELNCERGGGSYVEARRNKASFGDKT